MSKLYNILSLLYIFYLMEYPRWIEIRTKKKKRIWVKRQKSTETAWDEKEKVIIKDKKELREKVESRVPVGSPANKGKFQKKKTVYLWYASINNQLHVT